MESTTPKAGAAAAAARPNRFRKLRTTQQGKLRSPRLVLLVLLAVVVLGIYGLLSFGYRVAAGKNAPPLSAVIRRYISALPAGVGGTRRQQSGPSAAEARAALDVLKSLSADAGGDEKAELGYLSRLLEEQQAREAQDRMRKRLREQPGSGSGGSSSAVADALAQLRKESAGDAEMLASLDRVQAVLEGRAESLLVDDQRSDNSTADSVPA